MCVELSSNLPYHQNLIASLVEILTFCELSNTLTAHKSSTVQASRGGMLPYKVVVRHVDREEAVEQFDLLDEVLDYLATHMGHVFGRKDVIGILILKEE